MNPPNNDAKGPGSPSGAPSTGGPKIEPGKVESGKVEPGKIEPGKGIPPKPGVDAAKGDLGKPEAGKPEFGRPGAVKPTEPVRPDLSKDAAKAEPGKPEAPKTEAAKDGPKPDPLKPDAPKADAPKPGTFGGGPQAMPSKGPVNDGPIIDLKAKRLPDPPEPAKPAAAATAAAGSAKPADSKAFTTTGPSTAAKPSAETGSKPPADAGPRPAGSTTPKISPTPAEAAKSGGAGFGSMAAASLIGGVLGAGLLYAVDRAGVLGDDPRLAALDQRIAALAPKDALAALDKRIGASEATLKPLPDAVRTAEATAKEALQKAGSAPAPAAAPADASAPAAVAAPTPASLPADLIARLDGLDQRVAALQEEPAREQPAESTPATPSGGAAPARLASLDERLKAVEGKVEGGGKTAGAPGDLTAKVAALQSDVESRAKAGTEATQALGQKLAALQQSLDTRVQAATEAVQAATTASQQTADAGKMQAAEAAKAVERQLQAQSDKIAGLDKAVASRAEAGTVQAALRVVSADRIATALTTGAPYADALASLRATEPGDPARLTAVAAFADKGAPTAKSLAAEFRPIAERIAASRKAAQARNVAETGDIGQRLMSMAESIVQVRKVDAPAASGAAPSDPTPAVQDALDRGAIGEAAKAFASLPEEVRAQTAEFGPRLASRAAAGEAAQALLSDAFKALPATGASR